MMDRFFMWQSGSPPRHGIAGGLARKWPIATEIHVSWNVGDRGKSGLVVLNTSFVARDPDVWSGRAIDETVASGLASIYPAFDWSVVLRAHHGYQRACVLISR